MTEDFYIPLEEMPDPQHLWIRRQTRNSSNMFFFPQGMEVTQTWPASYHINKINEDTLFSGSLVSTQGYINRLKFQPF